MKKSFVEYLRLVFCWIEVKLFSACFWPLEWKIYTRYEYVYCLLTNKFLNLRIFFYIEKVSLLGASITLTLMTTIFLSICVCHWATDFTKWLTPPSCVLAWIVQHWIYTLQLLWHPIMMTPTIILTHEVLFRLIKGHSECMVLYSVYNLIYIPN